MKRYPRLHIWQACPGRWWIVLRTRVDGVRAIEEAPDWGTATATAEHMWSLWLKTVSGQAHP